MESGVNYYKQYKRFSSTKLFINNGLYHRRVHYLPGRVQPLTEHVQSLPDIVRGQPGSVVMFSNTPTLGSWVLI